MTDDADFARLVDRMRAAQKAYFADRTAEKLAEARSLEKQVDAEIDARKDGQGRLFG